MAINYDDAFRTLLNDCPQLIIPIINETFHLDYDGTEKIFFEPNEHFINRQAGEEGKVITDTCFGIISNRIERGKKGHIRKFHWECESGEYDATLLIRLYEYDTQIALDYNHRIEGNELIVEFPNTAVMVLRTTQNTPDEMRIRIVAPNGESISYGVPTMKVQNYTLEEIFQRKLLFLLPFYLMHYDKRLDEMEKDDNAVRSIVSEYEHIRERLDEKNQQKEISLEDKHIIMDMINHVAQLRCAKLDKIRKGVEKVMAGELLYSEAYEVLQKGRHEGLEKGREQGREQGWIEGQISMLKELVQKGIMAEADAAAMENEIKNRKVAFAEPGTDYEA